MPEWPSVLLGAVAGAVLSELARLCGALIRSRRLRPTAEADFLISLNRKPGIISLDLFVANRLDHELRPRQVYVKGRPDEGHVWSWTADSSPVIEPRHVTQVSLAPKHFLDAAARLKLDGDVPIRIEFYNGAKCDTAVSFVRPELESILGAWPPRTTDRETSGAHLSRIRAARERSIVSE